MNDYLIIGGGIVGISTAFALQQKHPNAKITLLEKQHTHSQHQTGRNSGVIHAGVYYPPDSLKAKFCREGLQRTMSFCQQYDVNYAQTGKLIVATDSEELERFHALYERCQHNQLSPQLLTQAQLRQREPNIAGVAAFLVDDTGICDYVGLVARVAELFLQHGQASGSQIRYNTQVLAVEEDANGVRVDTNQGQFRAAKMINCAGLQSDRIINMTGLACDFQIVPFRGDYYQLSAKHNQIIKHLIYPVPDPQLPFLGVHLTRMIDGSVTVGPNAALALAREGYGKLSMNVKDIAAFAGFGGFWKLMTKYPKQTINELQTSLFKGVYLDKVRRYAPGIQLQDLQPYRSGIRAQAVSQSGELIHDFKFVQSAHTLHVGNAPSPAATSAFPIADYIVSQCG